MHDVLLPTLGACLEWLVVGAVVAGCGHVVRHLVSVRTAFAAVDLWLGLAALVAYLQLWTLAGGVTAYAWIAPAVAAAAGIALAHRPRAPRLLPAALTLAGMLWLANRALGPAFDYDLGLYHASAIRYALDYGSVPGLANLHVRLGASDPHLLLVAFLQHGPFAGAAPHLVNGLLATFLLVEIATRAASGDSFTRRLALLLAPATIAVAGIGTAYRVASPNLDLGAFVLVAAAALYLAECVEEGARTVPALASLSTFAAAAATRPLYWAMTAIAAVVVFVMVRRLRAIAVVASLPALVGVGFLARQSVLSGYPLFPTTVAALSVGWRVPAALVRAETQIADAWARLPGQDPGQVLASWHWLSAWWHRRVRDFDVVVPVSLLTALVPGFLARGSRRSARPLLAIVVPSLVALAIWFFVAPDPRFVLAPLWLVAAALAAWAAPEGRLSAPTIVVGAAGAGALLVLALTYLQWFVLGALDALALGAVLLRFVAAPAVQRRFAQAALVALALVPVGFVADRGGFDLVHANATGALGTPTLPTPALSSFTTRSGLQLTSPVGSDQCWSVVLCTPQPSAAIALRGATIADGFDRIARPSAKSAKVDG
ncbi:MAG: hypothetical protein JO186_02320 [Actinobacteria bacterium]|nr:hypothetical protein [Actinomycetota bacterium]